MRHVVMLALAVAASCSTPAGAQEPPPITYRPELLVQIGVADLDRAITFYTGTLGFTLTERRNDLKFAHLDTNVPGLQIGLNEVTGAEGQRIDRPEHQRRRCLRPRADSSRRAASSFAARPSIIPGKVALAEFADPDGNVLRFAGPPPPRPRTAARSGGVRRPRRACARLLDWRMGGA